MKRLVTAAGQMLRETDGQDLLEYGLLAALIAVAAVAALTTLGTTIYSTFWSGIGQAV